MTDREILEQILEGQKVIQADIKSLHKEQSALQKDVKHIKKQADIYYDWVDRIDLRVKKLEDIISKGA